MSEVRRHTRAPGAGHVFCRHVEQELKETATAEKEKARLSGLGSTRGWRCGYSCDERLYGEVEVAGIRMREEAFAC